MTFTLQTKNASTFSKQTKNASTFANQALSKSDLFLLIDDTFCFLIDGTNRLIIGDCFCTPFTNQIKH